MKASSGRELGLNYLMVLSALKIEVLQSTTSLEDSCLLHILELVLFELVKRKGFVVAVFGDKP